MRRIIAAIEDILQVQIALSRLHGEVISPMQDQA